MFARNVRNVIVGALVVLLIPATSANATVMTGKLTDTTIALYNDPQWEVQWNLKQNYFDYLTPRIPMERPLRIAIIDTPINRKNPEFNNIQFIDGYEGTGQVLGKPFESVYFSIEKNGELKCGKGQEVIVSNCQ